MPHYPEWESPTEIVFTENEEFPGCIDITINGLRAGYIEPRPDHCDRGRWKFNTELPNIDSADGFPRYYMDLTRAKLEIISWLNWRLWRRRCS